MITIDETKFFEELYKKVNEHKYGLLTIDSVKMALQLATQRTFTITFTPPQPIHTGYCSRCGGLCDMIAFQNTISNVITQCCICGNATATCNTCLSRIMNNATSIPQNPTSTASASYKQ